MPRTSLQSNIMKVMFVWYDHIKIWYFSMICEVATPVYEVSNNEDKFNGEFIPFVRTIKQYFAHYLMWEICITDITYIPAALTMFSLIWSTNYSNQICQPSHLFIAHINTCQTEAYHCLCKLVSALLCRVTKCFLFVKFALQDFSMKIYEASSSS